MNDLIPSVALWLADFGLLSTALLTLALIALAALKQPAERLAITKSMLLALFLLAALCTLPGWSLVHLLASQQPRPDGSPVPPSNIVLDTNTPQAPAFNTEFSAPISPTHNSSVAPPAHSFEWRHLPWSMLAVSVYATGSACVVAWLILGALAARRLVRAARPAPEQLVEVLQQITNSDRRGAQLLVSPNIDVPVALSTFRPAILLPQHFIDLQPAIRYPQSEIQTILAHEAAHLRNHDLRWLAVSRALLVLLWPQPLYWLLRHWMRLDQETLADAAAAEHTSRQAYAEQLVTWARNMAPRPAVRLSSAVGLWEGPSQLRQRIALLIDEHITIVKSCSRTWRSGATAAAISAALLLSLVTLQPKSNAADESPAASKSSASNTDSSDGQAVECTGIVVDSRTGAHIKDATVTVSLFDDQLGNWDVLKGSKHVTNAEGQFRFTISAEQAANPRLIWLSTYFSHPDYAPGHYAGNAAKAMREQRAGGMPFYARLKLHPAEIVTGTVVKPDGSPAAHIYVLSYSMEEPKNFSKYSDFGHFETDENGRFRVTCIAGGSAVLSLLPKEFAPQTRFIDRQRGDLGTLKLEEGIRIRGRVLDQQGMPLPNVWVNADLMEGPAKKKFDLPVSDQIERSALTDSAGRFELAPLPPGIYRISPSNSPSENGLSDNALRPLPAAFLPQLVNVQNQQQPPDVEFRAADSVKLTVQWVDSANKPTDGFRVFLFGKSANDVHYAIRQSPDENGKVVFQAPQGLREAKLSPPGQNLRNRKSVDEPFSAGQDEEIPLGTLDKDWPEIQIARYKPTLLIVSAKDAAGNPVPGFKPALYYEYKDQLDERKNRWIDDVQGDVDFDPQSDGRWRSDTFLPDEKFTLTISADGYSESTQTLTLPEGETKEVNVTLTKSDSADKTQ